MKRQRDRMIISDKTQVEKLIKTVHENIEKTKEHALKILNECSSLQGLVRLKFDHTSCDPLSGKPINFIEMLNQTFSDLVVLKAVEDLLVRFPDKKFEVRMGTLAGYDICSTDNEIVAECFAAVTAFNNQKIRKDAEKLMQLGKGIRKYLYFYSREDTVEKIVAFMEKYPEITVVRYHDFE